MSNSYMQTEVAVMEAKSREVADIAEQINSELNSMCSKVRGGLSGTWAGEASQGFEHLLQAFTERQTKMYNILKDYSATIKTNGIAYAQVEDANKSTMRGLTGLLA